ncbi:flagellar hook-associated protein FlgK [Pantoea sp. Mb-10]|uniref:flagellar hook-associated protein FlgK n=1 Tax=unclassified Pantoea TaxID=2630326 RepID=UPI001E48DF86|nr:MULTISPECIES: flagellar hook-associated protein FlgK [unclassified Pantoea]MCE0489862.1 flagellar hook-associated protein FlgK [Pantoea sp. Mb-10]MCE0501032.1 flagellar hook-associated protein FlgK [Pantoea sp. Pb-8]
MSIINIGYSGASAARIGMNVTALNIANAATKGFSRQRIQQNAIGPAGVERLFSGSGVEVSGIERIADRFRIGQVWRANTQNDYFSSSQRYLGALETLLSAENTGVGDGLDTFFAALSGATEKPDSDAMRQTVLSEAQALATRINHVQNFLQQQRSESEQQQRDLTASINHTSEAIAHYNARIKETVAAGGDASILRDQRDEQVRALSGYLDIRVQESETGEYTLTLPSGQPLVSGSEVGALSMQRNASGAHVLQLSFAGSAYEIDSATGGQLGAMHDYQVDTLDSSEARLGGMAEAMAKAFNDRLAKGFDLKGNAGKPLFNFNPNHPTGMLQVNALTAEELAFSADPTAPGNNQNLLDLLAIKQQRFSIAGQPPATLDEASNAMIGAVGIKSRQNQTELSAAQAWLQNAETERDNLSAVDYDEEYVNLTQYTQAYQANMKVIATGDRIFTDLLALF